MAHHEKTGSGSFAGAFIGEYFITTSDPGNIKVILATEFNNFEKGTSDSIVVGCPLAKRLSRILLSRNHGIGARRRRF